MIVAMLNKAGAQVARRSRSAPVNFLAVSAFVVLIAACTSSQVAPTSTPTPTPGTTTTPSDDSTGGPLPTPPLPKPTLRPGWLKTLISQLEQEPVGNPPPVITEYQYQGQTVYFLDRGGPKNVLYDAEGSIIGHPEKGDGDLPGFFEERAGESLVWFDNRHKDTGTVKVTAPIKDVWILVSPTIATGAGLTVVSGLPDSCESFDESTVTREGDKFFVNVTNLRKTGADLACAEVYRTASNTIPLPGGVETCTWYEVEVNKGAHYLQAIDPSVRCRDTGTSVPTPTAPPTTGTRPDTDPSGDSSCSATRPSGIAVGDDWTLAGPVRIEGPFPGEIPDNADTQVSGFTVLGIGDADSKVRLLGTLSTLDTSGSPIDFQDEEGEWRTNSVLSHSPVLTLDWECHAKTWLNGWQTTDSPSVDERTSSPGLTLIVFSVIQPLEVPDQGIKGVAERALGYDKATGRLALQEMRLSGTAEGVPFSMKSLLELVSEGTVPGGSVPLDKIPGWLADLISKLESGPVADPPASITQYEYKGQTVYFLPQRCCDIWSDLYDSEGDIIGHPDGGITGEGDRRVPDFFDERKNERRIWADSRKVGPNQARVLAPIDSLDILVLESFPLQYDLLVVSGLPDSCAVFDGYTLARDGTTIRVEMWNLRNSDPNLACAQVYGSVETRIQLGSDFAPETAYTVDVNGETISFKGDSVTKELVAVPDRYAQFGCGLDLDLVTFLDGQEVKPTLSSFRCGTGYVDSTGRFPEKSPSSLIHIGGTVDFEFVAEEAPSSVELRLYATPGEDGYFLGWPENRPGGAQALSRHNPPPSSSFSYIPDVPVGEYSVVLQVRWQTDIVAFYALSFAVEE